MNRNINVPFFKPSIGKKEYRYIRKVLKSGWLTSGKFCTMLEERFRDICSVKHAISCNSATAGLHLSLEALGNPDAKYVITTPYTFTATAEITRYLGAEPVFVDIDSETFNMDPALLAGKVKRIRADVRAIIPVHFAGLPCAMDEINEAASGIPVIEDAAHAFPTLYKGRFCGSLGNAGVFSFYANKTITTGEGGMVLCDDDDTAARIRLMRSHGMNRAGWNRYTAMKDSWQYDVMEAGYKYNLPDINAAIGLAQLEQAFSFKNKRKTAADYYYSKFAGLDFLKMPARGTDHSWHLFVVRIVPGKLNISRDEFIQKLKEAGIGCSVHYIPLHLMTWYKKNFGLKPEDFPVALENYMNAVSLPLFPSISGRQLRHTADTVINIGKRYYNNFR